MKIDRKIRHASSNALENVLLREGRSRWLDIGCGGNFAPGFYYMDYYSNAEVPEDCKDRFFRMDIAALSDENYQQLGKFDLLRMQHVFEHFTPEEGEAVLLNCSKLLNKGGYIVITVPDLKKFIKYYRQNSFKNLYTFYHWSLSRIPKDAPASFFFSVYTHSLLHEQHKWCYDAEGLCFMLNKSGMFSGYKELRFSDKLASVPFTHGRPWEDVCVVAKLIDK